MNTPVVVSPLAVPIAPRARESNPSLVFVLSSPVDLFSGEVAATTFVRERRKAVAHHGKVLRNRSDAVAVGFLLRLRQIGIGTVS